MNSSFIEKGRARLRTRELIGQTNRDLFSAATAVLRTKGLPKQRFYFGYLEVLHTVNSDEPPVRVRICSSEGDLDKNRKVQISIEGVGELKIEKKGHEKQETFKAKERQIGFNFFYDQNGGDQYPGCDLERVEGYLSAVRQVKSDLGVI